MLVKDLMVKDIIFVSPEDTLNTALSLMKKNSVHQLVVMDKGAYKGMINIKSIITRDFDAEHAKVGTLVAHTPVIESKETMERAKEILIGSGSKALPVRDGEKIAGVLSETDIITNIETDRTAKDLMTECEFIDKDDNIGKLRAVFFKNNISRVPVKSGNEVVGMADMLDMIKIYRGRKYEARAKVTSRGFSEKQNIDEVPVSVIMRDPKIIKEDTPINEVAKLLQENEEVLIDCHGSHYIIVPKDILELIKPEQKEGVYVQITHLGDEDAFTKEKIDASVNEFVQKVGRMLRDVNSLNIHIERFDKTGKRIRYHIRTRFYTPFGLFVSSADGWEIVSVLQQALNRLETELVKKHEKSSSHKMRTHQNN